MLLSVLGSHWNLLSQGAKALNLFSVQILPKKVQSCPETENGWIQSTGGICLHFTGGICLPFKKS